MKFKQYIKEAKDFKEKYAIKQCGAGLGFSEKLQKWFGWSHRAICGFGIGDKLFDKNWTSDGSKASFSNTVDDNLEFTERGEVTIKTLDQAKQAAKNFSKYVS